MVNLAKFHGEFKGEKIEGVCVSGAKGEELILHMVSDNDLGQSKLFNVKVRLG